MLVDDLLHEVGREVITRPLSLVLKVSLAGLGGWVWRGICGDIGRPAPNWGFWPQCFNFFERDEMGGISEYATESADGSFT